MKQTVAEHQAFARTVAIQKQQRQLGNMIDGANQSERVDSIRWLNYAAPVAYLRTLSQVFANAAA
jgi:hypothetical protein